MSESTKDEFTARCKLLENIVNCWEAGKSVSETHAFIAEISSKDQSVVSSTDCELQDMLPTSGNGMYQASTTVAEIQVSASIAQVTASSTEVPVGIAELNQDNASVMEMNQDNASVVEMNQDNASVAEMNQVPTSVAMVRQPSFCA